MNSQTSTFEIGIAHPDQETVNGISTMVVSNFQHDPMYADYDPNVLDSYIASNSVARTAETLANPNSMCFVARSNAEILGAVVLGHYERGYPSRDSVNAWRIRRLHVGFGFRKLGIARRLLATAEDFVCGEGHAVIYAEPTPEAAPLLLAHGWQGVYAEKSVVYRNEDGESTAIKVPRFIAHKTLSSPVSMTRHRPPRCG